jgi:transmembrane sensor
MKTLIRFVGGAAGAAAVIYLFLCALSGHGPEAPALSGSYSTVKGEHRCETLPDGSRVCLNTDSVVRYTYSRSTRNVELVSGEASFEVKGDSRQFDVLSGRLLIHDVSTSFDVYRKNDSTLVTVIGGRVRLVGPLDGKARVAFNQGQAESYWKTAPEIHRLQQVEFGEASGKLREYHSLTEQSLAQLLAWQRGRIELTNRPLTDALQEFARYQPIQQFNIQDKDLRRLRMGGELEATHLMDFLDSLARLYGIQHTLTMGPDGQTVVTLSRPRHTSK